MSLIEADRSFLLLIDFQARLMPAIHDGAKAVLNADRLIAAASLLDIPRLVTEQNPKGLGHTVAELAVEAEHVVHKQHFGACREDGFLQRLPAGGHIIVAGCEAHVCVLQTVLGLLGADYRVSVVRDAVGSRSQENKEAGLQRMAHHGADIVTTEMVLFEWLQTAEHPAFRPVVGLIK